MKKKFLIFIAVLFIKNGIFAQMGQTPVIDVTSIATAIENGYMLYQQIQANLETVKNTYENLMAIKDQMVNFDLSRYNWDKWDAFLHATDDFMTLQDDLYAILDNKDMQFGNMRYSINDLFQGDTYSRLLNEAERNLNPAEMTDEDRTAFIARHGMTPAHYHTLVNLDIQMTEKAKQVIAKNKVREQVTEEVVQMLPSLSEQVGDTSINELGTLQLQTQILQSQNQNIAICAQALMEQSSLQAYALQKEIENDNELKENMAKVADSFNNYDYSINQYEVCDDDGITNPYLEEFKMEYSSVPLNNGGDPWKEAFESESSWWNVFK